MMKCRTCGHSFLLGEFAPELLRELYSRYYPRSSFDLASYRPYEPTGGFCAWLDGSMSAAFRWVPRNIRILDIGCGFGESLGYHKARGCDVYGVEADENIRRVAEKFGLKVHVGLFDSALYQTNYFDYVTMDQVIEHVTDPVRILRGVARILKPGGVVVLGSPDAGGWGARVFRKRWINWHAPYHLHFFSKHSMQLAADQAGLVLEQSRTITPSIWLYFQWMHLLTCPQEGTRSALWVPGGKWSLWQRVVLRMLRLVHLCRINHVISRLFDALEMGDNRIYILRKPV